MGTRTFRDLRVDGSPLSVGTDAADVTAPTIPTNLAVVGSPAATSVNLTWTASTDAVGVVSYKVFQDSVVVATPASNAATVSGLTAETTYIFEVSALDAAGNESEKSIALSVTTDVAGNVTYQNLTTFTHEDITVTFASPVNAYVGLDGALQIEEGAGGVKPVVQSYSPPWQVMPPTAGFDPSDDSIDATTFFSQFVNGAEVNPSLANKAQGERETTEDRVLFNDTLRFRSVEGGGTGHLSAGDKLVITRSFLQGYNKTVDIHRPLHDRALVIQVHANGSLPTVPSFRSSYTANAAAPTPDSAIGYEIFTNSTLAEPVGDTFPKFATVINHFARVNAFWLNTDTGLGNGVYFQNSTQFGMTSGYQSGHTRNANLGQVLLGCLTNKYTEQEKVQLIRQVFRFCDDIYEISKTGAPVRWYNSAGQLATGLGPACFVRAVLTNDSTIFADLLARQTELYQEQQQVFELQASDLAKGFDGVSVFQPRDNEVYFMGPQTAGNVAWKEENPIPHTSTGSLYGYALDNCLPKFKWITPFCDVITDQVVGMPNLRTQWGHDATHKMNDTFHVFARDSEGFTTNSQLSTKWGFTLVNSGNVAAIGNAYSKSNGGVNGFFDTYRSQFGPAIYSQTPVS